MDGEAEDVVGVGRVEPLFVGVAIIDHAQCSNMVHYFSSLCIVQVVTAVVPSIAGG